MKFTAREDIEVPIEEAFKMVSDVDAYERMAIRNGVDIERLGECEGAELGMKWQAQFSMRGKKRDITLEITNLVEPEEISIQSDTQGVMGLGQVELVALSRSITRMSVELDLKPSNLKARLLMQSVKLAKGALSKRYKSRISDFAKHLEQEYNS